MADPTTGSASQLRTAKEVAQRLNVAPRTVYNWIALGKLPAIRIGGLWRIHEDTVAGIEDLARNLEADAIKRWGR